jgi:hypothetical protein
MPSLAGTYNMVVDQGATFYRAIVKKDPQGRTIPLTNVNARMQVRSSYDSLTPILNLTTENNFIVIEERRGIITLNISDIITSGLSAGEYVYDLELIYPDDRVERLVMGTFTVRREVTR